MRAWLGRGVGLAGLAICLRHELQVFAWELFSFVAARIVAPEGRCVDGKGLVAEDATNWAIVAPSSDFLLQFLDSDEMGRLLFLFSC